MTNGYWFNYDRTSDNVFEIDEHERWIRRPGNAEKLGVPSSVMNNFDNFEPVRDRDQFLLYVMAHAPVMRLRGHGASWTFEFASMSASEPLAVLSAFCEGNAGDFTYLVINNFARNESMEMTWAEFKGHYKQGAESMMAAADVREMRVKADFLKYVE